MAAGPPRSRFSRPTGLGEWIRAATGSNLEPGTPGHFWLQWARHTIAGCVHLLSATTILTIGLSERPLSEYALNIKEGGRRVVWKVACYLPTIDKYVDDSTCLAENKAFYSEGLRGSSTDAMFTLNVLFWAFVFAAWSGLLHVVVAARLWRRGPEGPGAAKTQRTARWSDYSVSAPLMLAVLGASFGAANVHGVVVAPLGLCALIVAGGYLEEYRLSRATPLKTDKGKQKAAPPPKAASTWEYAVQMCGAAVLFTLYVFVWDPVMSAYERSRVQTGSNVGTPPDAVTIMLVSTIVVFSSFAAVYAYDLSRQVPGASEQAYIFLSMFSKVLLHSFVGLAVLQQRSMLQSSRPTHSRPPNPPTSSDAVWAICGALSGSLLVHFFVSPAVGRWADRHRPAPSDPKRVPLWR